MNILMACDYKGLNPGNFIPSIRALDQYVQKRGDKVIYAFSVDCVTVSVTVCFFSLASV